MLGAEREADGTLVDSKYGRVLGQRALHTAPEGRGGVDVQTAFSTSRIAGRAAPELVSPISDGELALPSAPEAGAESGGSESGRGRLRATLLVACAAHHVATRGAQTRGVIATDGHRWPPMDTDGH